VAHLAGALGVPVWLALPFACDWRWLSGRDDSPWYPTMRLFRQKRWGDWDEVFERMAAELRRRQYNGFRSSCTRDGRHDSPPLPPLRKGGKGKAPP
jgi:hypothetical protein